MRFVFVLSFKRVARGILLDAAPMHQDLNFVPKKCNIQRNVILW